LVLGAAIVTGVAILVLIGVTLGRHQLSALIGEPKLAPYLWWLPLSVLATGLYKVLNYWATRKTHYTRLSISQGIRSAGVAGTQTSAGYFQAGPTGLVGGQVTGEVLATVTLGWQTLKEDLKSIYSAVRPHLLKKGASDYSKFPKFTAPQGLINSISQNAPSYLLVFFYDPKVVGYYWFTKRLLRASSRLLGKAVRKVFYQRAAEKYKSGDDLHSFLFKVTAVLFSLFVVPVAVLFFFGSNIFSFIFGAEWHRAGVYAGWMSLWTLFQFSNIPSIMVIYIIKKQSYLLLFEVFLAVGRIASIPLGYILGNDITSILIFSVMGALLNLFLISVVHIYTNRQVR
jgi:O-antigen/teichoic acid export membrane protein